VLLSQDRAPFAAALAPWRTSARQRLLARVRAIDAVLGPRALDGLLANLDVELGVAAAPALLDAFRRDPDRRWFTRHTSDDYRAFAARLVDGRLDELLAGAPVLADLLELVAADWGARTVALTERLRSDRAALRERFGFRLPVARACPVVSTAIGLRDGDGQAVIYKARSLTMDAAFAALLRWLNTRAPAPALHVVEIVERPGYGWMTLVPHGSIPGGTGRAAYLVRSGMLLCLVHLLGGGDLHAANIRCANEHPVIVDAEVLLRPRRAGDDERGGFGPSVASTGWLPVPGDLDRCGLAAEHYRGRALPWLEIGTDGVRPRPQAHTRGRVRPRLVEAWAREAPDIVAHLCAGFSAGYALVRRHGLPLELFVGAAPRILLRTSRLYGDAIERSLAPACLTSVAARNRAFDWVDREIPPSLRRHPEVAARVAEAERASMRRLEMPRFVTPATARTLCCGDQVLGTPFDESPLERASRFLAAMSPAAEATQRKAIAGAVYAAASGSFDAVGVRFELVTSEEQRAWSMA
jgi:hypothetical protein